MNLRQTLPAILLWIGLLSPGAAQISEQECASRRARVLSMLDSSSAMVLAAADSRTRSKDVNYPYRQDSDFLYLTGINEPSNFLILVPSGLPVKGRRERVLLFTSGPAVGTNLKDGAVLAEDQFSPLFDTLASCARILYLSTPDIRFTNDWLNDRRFFLDRDSRRELEKRHSGLKTKSASGLIANLRGIKSEEEVTLIKKAIQLTGAGLQHAMALCKPGAKEFELQAAVEYEMIRRGAVAPGFPSIVGSGENSLIPHYDENKREMKGGEVVVLDVGAEWNGYTADVTRTLPVSGHFTKEQARIYAAVLKAQKETIRIIRPGLPWAEIDRKAKDVITQEGFGKYTLHSITHHIGLDVHDVGAMDTLRAGMVLTVEPGIYIPKGDTSIAPGYRTTGIRIEDDVLVTQAGCVVLSSGIPKEIAEVERAMRRKSGGAN